MRYRKPRADAGEQRMGRQLLARKYTGHFLFERNAFDAVIVENGGVRRQARPDRRDGIVARPVDQSGQCRPIRLVLKLRGARLGASHDQAVELRFAQLGHIAIACGKPPPRRVGARDFGDGEQLEADDNVVRRCTDEIEELPLGRLARRVGHIVDQPDSQAIAAA